MGFVMESQRKVGRPAKKREFVNDKQKYINKVATAVDHETDRMLKSDAFLRTHRCGSSSEFIRQAIHEKIARHNEIVAINQSRDYIEFKLEELQSSLINSLNNSSNNSLSEAINSVINSNNKITEAIEFLSNAVTLQAKRQLEIDAKLVVLAEITAGLQEILEARK